MARKVNQATTEPEANEESAAPAPLPGGTPGVIENATQTIAEPGKASASVPTDKRPEARDMKPPPRFRVVNGGQVWIHGYGAHIKPGRVIDETMYDLDLLRRQGIQLQQVD